MRVTRPVEVIALCLLCFHFSCVKAIITSSPKNAIIVKGQETMLNCSSNQTVPGGGITWVNSKSNTIINRACQVVSSFQTGYGSSNTSNGECNIIIKPDDLDVAGTYTCSDTLASNVLTFYATLVVLASEPTCVPDKDPVVQGEAFNIVCSVDFSLGAVVLYNAPATGWLSCNGYEGQKQNYSVSGLATTRFSLPTLTIPMSATGTHIPSFGCSVNFDFTPQTSDSAGNSVNYTVILDESKPYYYCPKNATIVLPSTRIYGGDELNCSADSYPSPSYQWIGLGPSPINGSTVKIPDHGGPFNVTCSATGSLGDRNCTAYWEIVFFAVVCPYNVTINPPNPVVTVNTTLSCSASSTSQSPATYLWTNLLDSNSVPVNGSQITIDKPGAYNWRCSVSLGAEEGGLNCNNSRTINGTAVECPSESNTVITSSGGSGSVLVGDVFNCSLHTDQPASYQWYDGSGHLLSSLSSVVVNMSGVFNWTCVATVTVGSFICKGSKPINGTAYECPSNISVEPSATKVVKLFDKFTCSASGSSPSHYSWRDETASELSTTTVLSANTPGQHSYTCSVTLTAGNRTCADNKTVNVTVVDCPHDVMIQSSAGSEPLLVGDLLNCSATSYPPANYSWYDASGHLLSSVSTVNVTTTHQFTWTCYAAVSVDGLVCNSSNTTTATALECPSNVTTEPSSRRVVKLHDSLQCFSSGNVTNFTWLSDTGAVLSTTSILTVTELGGNLTYTCRSTLHAGNRQCNASQLITVDVIDCPNSVTIQTPSNVNTIYVGDTFNCTAVSSAHVDYSWYDQHNNLLSNHSSVTISSPGDFVLNCTATVELNGFICVNSTTFNGTATITTSMTTASSTPTTTSVPSTTTMTTATSTPATTSVPITSAASTTSSAASTSADTLRPSSVPTTSSTSSVPTTSSTAVSIGSTSSSLSSPTAAATTAAAGGPVAADTASSSAQNTATTSGNTSPSATSDRNPAVLVIEIVVPVTLGLAAVAAAGVWCSYYAFVMTRRRRRRTLQEYRPTRLAPPIGAEPSVYSPRYAFRPYYSNGRF